MLSCIQKRVYALRGLPRVHNWEAGNMAGTTEYKNKWQLENKDRINLVVNKGQKKLIKAHAESNGESVNGFLQRAIVETIQRDTAAIQGGK